MVWSFLFSLGSHSKHAGDESHLIENISLAHVFHLPFPDHIHRLKALECSPGCLEREEAHPRLRQAFDARDDPVRSDC